MDEQKEPLWWLSFADDAGFRGVVLVRGASDTKAIRLAHALGCNPGGEVLSAEIPDEGAAFIVARDPGLLGRLLDKGEAQALGDALDARFNNEDSPGMPPGQAAEASEGPTVVRVEEENPGPGCGVPEAPARAQDDERIEGVEARLVADPGHNATMDVSSLLVPPSTWLPPGASEPEPLGLTDAQVERLLRDGAPVFDDPSDVLLLERIRARLFGKGGGT
jgi:hypothetical protein